MCDVASILILVHIQHMICETIQSRPSFAWGFAIFALAHITRGLARRVLRDLVPMQVVDRHETILPQAARHLALERLMVLSHMLAATT
jgi:hypothetical protein